MPNLVIHILCLTYAYINRDAVKLHFLAEGKMRCRVKLYSAKRLMIKKSPAHT
jgi:uncharacterized integral membrane protein